MYAISDKQMVGFDISFNPGNFLFKQGSCLKLYKDNGFVAGNIINSYCAQFNINQRIILVTIQRESGLIGIKTIEEAVSKKNDAGLPVLDWACCVGLPDDWTQIKESYRGFSNQIRGACSVYKYWFSNFQPNTKKEMVGESPIICDNAGTFALAMFTPHSESFALTAKLYKQYFPDFKV